jgi:hypothetical protein
VANYLVLTTVDADPALSAEQSRPKGRLVLPIFIRQGWPQAMSHYHESRTHRCVDQRFHSSLATVLPNNVLKWPMARCGLVWLYPPERTRHDYCIGTWAQRHYLDQVRPARERR